MSSTTRLRSADRVLPHPPHRLPILGDVLDLHITDSSQWGWRDAQRYGPIFERRILGARVTYVSGPDLVEEVNDESTWAKFLGVPIRNLRSIAKDGLFTAHNSEPNWAKAHAILGPAFTQAAMRGYHDIMVGTVRELVDSWQTRPSGAWVEIPSDMNKLTLEIIGRTGFGYDFGSFTEPEAHPFVGQMSRALAYVNRSAYSHPLVENTFYRQERAQHSRDLAAVQTLVDDVIAKRSAKPRPEESDLLDRMLNTPDPETGQRLDPENIRNQILTFLVAGHETSAGALAFALHFIATNPDVAARARAEVDTVWPVGDNISYEHIGKLRYLRRILDETLRLWPVAPGYFRKAKADTILGGQYPFQKGEWVFVVLLQLHRDAEWGADPEVFDPDRFLPERVRARRADLYRPFGTGMRACIGRQFAQHEILLTLATLLRNFEFEADPNYDLRVKEMITLKPDGLRMRLHAR
ncbi:cytochrome P450 [Rhodococcus sp. BP-252]|nr:MULTISPECIES: cytochrome P450 [unclassified Rhodococcus (in: high G+C Gram-positive bacteria)]MBY6417603.1 cytochrome P450 [Rhodococcus sp. BP-321]MBY6423455.1 cytochrome P450 [Rhodococcus sp. BP-324]MBY6427627.1 cytochrome P450 [Rhodococcus sp. BP-323]MBY6432791.1 cytochrome P450 [Rhodococcus sp. BP-322]MBY6446585.1 cytochrome P450 [Rhodococcus sp. BP-318]MBY6451384.1 cytochrome P450 [Rhodococcus sp. BP-315]MBY6456160.1 cytochrome P450 [Rhodococcus sp. BP-277]MBY6466045.1 cytochrome P45